MNMELFFERLSFFMLIATLPFYVWISEEAHKVSKMPNLEGILSWIYLDIYFVLVASLSIWKFFELVYETQRENENETFAPDENTNVIRDTRYDHIYQEITRYRNIQWQIPLFAWGIYGTLIWFRGNEFFKNFYSFAFLFFVFLTAFFATVFLLFCEYIANRNRGLRREVESIMNLDPGLRHRIDRESIAHPGFWISEAIFIAVLWAPPFVMLYARS